MNLKTLLKNYMSSTISADDFKTLKDSVGNLSDKDLDASLETLWAESDRKKMDAKIKKEVGETLHRRLFATNVKLFSLNWKNLSAAVLLPLFMVSATALFFLSKQPETQNFVVKSAKGQKTQIDLPDGTKVWLNSASQISYNSNFNQKNRYISLKGEAFFDVQQNEKSMFIVDVGGVEVNVHGTAFNVTAYEGDSLVCVSLNRGRVSLENTGSHYTIARLLPNQQVTVNRKNLSSEFAECDAELNSLWIEGRLKFDDATPTELFKKMEHWYGVNIHVSNINPAHIYSLTVKTESLREMLDLINKLTPISYTINGEEVNIIYKR